MNTLPDSLTDQQAFEIASKHLLKQGKRSMMPAPKAWEGLGLHDDDTRCAYRGSDGAACAVGCLLTDDEATKCDALDHSGVDDLVEAGLLPERLRNVDLGLLKHLQKVHDCESVECWQGQLRVVGEDHGLDCSFLGGES